MSKFLSFWGIPFLFSTLLSGSGAPLVPRGPASSTDKEIPVLHQDPLIRQNWGLKNSQAEAAWKLQKGSKKVVVAVIDTGADMDHPDLKNNIWINRGEWGYDSKGRSRATNRIDDDGNGYIDDVHGWNFVAANNDLEDHHGHGTHIAGIIGAEGGNGVGISGVAPKVSLMILKYYDSRAPAGDNLRLTIEAIRYATRMGAHIINYSGGGLAQSPRELEAITQAGGKNILFIAAAGNERSNSDREKYFPAGYQRTNILTVAASNRKNALLATSNFGKQSVDLVAPGQDIYSTFPEARYGQMTGTSQATAFVSGVAALLRASHPELQGPEEMINYLVQTGDPMPGYKGKTRYGVRLNAFRALSMKDSGLNAFGLPQPKPQQEQLVRLSQQLLKHLKDHGKIKTNPQK